VSVLQTLSQIQMEDVKRLHLTFSVILTKNVMMHRNVLMEIVSQPVWYLIVVLMLNVDQHLIQEFATVLQDTLEMLMSNAHLNREFPCHQFSQNVSQTMNVLKIDSVLIRNVLIHVFPAIFVDEIRSVMLIIIIQSASVLLGILEIQSLNAFLQQLFWDVFQTQNVLEQNLASTTNVLILVIVDQTLIV
jgi:hypothetical protein